jgi:tryptophan-rich sensory protein
MAESQIILYLGVTLCSLVIYNYNTFKQKNKFLVAVVYVVRYVVQHKLNFVFNYFHTPTYSLVYILPTH